MKENNEIGSRNGVNLSIDGESSRIAHSAFDAITVPVMVADTNYTIVYVISIRIKFSRCIMPLRQYI